MAGALKQIAPGVKRAVVLRDATQPTGIAQLAAMQSVAPLLGVELSPVGVRDPDEIERDITAFARAANGGLIVTSGARTIRQRDQIIALAARHRLPGVYPERIFVAGGGLISTGPTRRINTGGRPNTLIASSRAKSQPTCRCSSRPSLTS